MGLSLPLESLPTIEISLASPEEHDEEPYSPFSFSFDAKDKEQQSINAIDAYDNDNDNDNYRPTHLSPPPTQMRLRPTKTLSPLAGEIRQGEGKGLDADRFEALLKSSKTRNTSGGMKQKEDLRKEILSNAHKHKQLERRALFLSKLAAPPSPTATMLPKTPPESPSVFYYTLPSPGLVSPLALFDSLKSNTTSGPLSYARSPWVEQVDFRKSINTKSPRRPLNKRLPSLDEISARLELQKSDRSRGPAPLSIQQSGNRGPSRLPAFLKHARRFSDPIVTTSTKQQEEQPGAEEEEEDVDQPKFCLVVDAPASGREQRVIEPATSSNTREKRAHNMLSTIRRRVVSESESEGDKTSRRRSAPAQLTQANKRSGFEHPVLSLPGAF